MRKYLWCCTLGFLGLAGCHQYVEGELTLLLDSKGSEELKGSSFYSASWSSDESRIYCISNWDSNGCFNTDRVWSIDVDDGTMTQISDNSLEIWELHVSYQENLCLPYFPDISEIFVYDLESWALLYSMEPETSYNHPRFSMENPDVFYYTTKQDGKMHLHKMNWVDSTDEIVFSGDGGYPVIPGPGDSLFVMGDSVHNLNSGERTGIPKTSVMSWNPACPTELVYANYDELVIFDTEIQKKHYIDVRSTDLTHIKSVRFSSDGQKIVFAGFIGGDAIHIDEIWIWKRGSDE